MFDLDKITRTNIRLLSPYKSARSEYSGSQGIFLDANENPYGSLNRYPDPLQQQLKDVISKQKNIAKENIFIGNGSDEIIDLVFRIFCRPGKDSALIFTPTYGMYEVSAKINDVELMKLPLNESFDLDDAVMESISNFANLKLVLLCSPNNPTGNCLNPKIIEDILMSFNGIVFIDEAYIDFSDQPSFIRLIDEYANLIIGQTLSKAWGAASARIGMAFSNNEIIELLNKIKPPYNVSASNQKAAIQTLENKLVYVENIQQIRRNRAWLCTSLKNISFVEKIHPSQANFLLIEVSDADVIYNALIAHKIIVRNRNSEVKNSIRITVGTKDENEQLINSLKIIENEKSTIY